MLWYRIMDQITDIWSCGSCGSFIGLWCRCPKRFLTRTYYFFNLPIGWMACTNFPSNVGNWLENRFRDCVHLGGEGWGDLEILYWLCHGGWNDKYESEWCLVCGACGGVFRIVVDVGDYTVASWRESWFYGTYVPFVVLFVPISGGEFYLFVVFQWFRCCYPLGGGLLIQLLYFMVVNCGSLICVRVFVGHGWCVWWGCCVRYYYWNGLGQAGACECAP